MAYYVVASAYQKGLKFNNDAYIFGRLCEAEEVFKERLNGFSEFINEGLTDEVIKEAVHSKYFHRYLENHDIEYTLQINRVTKNNGVRFSSNGRPIEWSNE